MAKRKPYISFVGTHEMADQLRYIAKAEDRSQSAILRRIVGRYISEWRHPETDEPAPAMTDS